MVIIKQDNQKFHRLEKEDYIRIRQLRDRTQHPLTATSEKSIFSWQYYYHFKGYDGGDFFLIYSEALHRFLYPFGRADQGLNFIQQLKWPLSQKNFAYLSVRQAEELEKAGYLIAKDRNDSEYVYAAEALALQSGNISANLKRKYRKFACKYPYTVHRIDFSWPEKAVHRGYVNLRPEVEHMIKHYMDYEMSGIEIQYQDERAFIFGYENTADMFTMTAVDYTKGFGPDAVAVCICEMARQLCGHYTYINLEEDMGISGLRQMKQQYLPAYLLEAYHADFKNDSYQSG